MKPLSLQQRADAAWKEWGKSKSAKRKRRREAKRQQAEARSRWVHKHRRAKWLRANGTVDYFAYIRSNAWRKRKQRFVAKHGCLCQICSSSFRVDLHHKSYRNLGREPDGDLQLLCHGCHANAHEQDGKATDPIDPAPPLAAKETPSPVPQPRLFRLPRRRP